MLPKKICLYGMVFLLVITPIGQAFSHPGETDTYGCHVCEEDCNCWSGVEKGVLHCHEFKGKIHSAPVVHSSYQCGAGTLGYSSNNTVTTHHYHSYDSYYYGSYGHSHDPEAELAAAAIVLGAIILGAVIFSAASSYKERYERYRKYFVGLYTHDLHLENYPNTHPGRYVVKKNTCGFSFNEAELISFQDYERKIETMGLENMKQKLTPQDRKILRRYKSTPFSTDKQNLYYLAKQESPFEIYQVLRMMKDGTVLGMDPYYNRVEQFCYGTVKVSKRKKIKQDKLELYCKRYSVEKRKEKHCQLKMELQ